MPSSTSLLRSIMACAAIVQGISGQQTNVVNGETIVNDSPAATNCPGVAQELGNGVNYCCIGVDLNIIKCDGWPFCTGDTREAKTMQCSTRIPLTASDYDDQIKSAKSKYSIQDTESTATDDSASSATSTKGSDKEGDEETDEETGKETIKETASSTSISSAATASETDNASNMRMPSLVGGVLGGMLVVCKFL